jgi:uncharacterized membrane protein
MLKRPAIVSGVLCVAYVALRLWRLTDSCLWFDEIFSVHAAEQQWGSLFWFVAQDLVHPPLFYVLLKIWIGIGGESLLWLRLFPVLLAVAALIPFIYLCRELKLKTPTTLLALLFFAANGSLIKYTQEVRMYSLLLCFSLFSIWLFARFFYRGKNIWILTLLNILLVYTHYFGWLIVVAEVAVILVLQRIKIRHVLIMSGIALVAYIPWIVAIVKAASSGPDVRQNIGWITRPGLRSVFDFAFDLIEPFYFQQSSADDPTKLFFTLPLLAIIVIAKLIYLIDWKRHNEWDRFWLLSIIFALPLFLAFVLSWILPVSIWGSRHLITVFAPMMIVAAIFATEIAIRPVKYLFVSAILLLTGTAFVLQARSEQPKFIWCAWEDLGDDLPTNRPQTVYVFEDLVAYHFWFVTRQNGNVQIIKVDDMPDMIEDKAYFLPRGFDGVRRTDVGGMEGDRFWVAFRDMNWNEKHPPINILTEKGYTIGRPISVMASGMNAFVVEVTK